MLSFMVQVCGSALVLAWSALSAKTVRYDFDIGWVTANPDGNFERPTIGINGQWPLPMIEADLGDQIVINVVNSLGNQSTSLHFHGLFMNGTTHMDGPVQVSQCAIPPGSRFTYNFTVNQPGSYWYHSHNKGQYPDGLRGPMIIHDPRAPIAGKYDTELVISVSDWYHDQMPGLIKRFTSKFNPTGAEPVPKAVLLNDTQDLQVRVSKNTTYLIHFINIGAFAGQYIWFEGHNMTIVELDGVYTDSAEASMIYISAAQRCSVLVTTRNTSATNFPFVASMDTTLFDKLPQDLNYNATGWLVYNASSELPEAAMVDELIPFDDMTLVPADAQPLLPPPDRTVELNVIMDNLGDGANYAFFDDITYKHPVVPTLYTVMTSGEQAVDPSVYGTYTRSVVLEKDEVVQIVVNNLDTGRHPFHLHGHNFQSIFRSDEDAGVFADANATEADFPRVPMRRDTLVLYPNGNIVIRFRADNPGVWLFHCHIEWHVVSGLVATFIEAPLAVQKNLVLPQDHLDACGAANVPTAGNAAGNTHDLLDLTGQPSPPPALPAGFETRGIVALAFSCLCGVIGVVVVAWYGYAKALPEKPEQSGSPVRESDTHQSDEIQQPAKGQSRIREEGR